MPKTSGQLEAEIGNATWIALALLHNEKPDRSSFTFEEVDERVGREFGTPASGLLRWAFSLETLGGLGVGIANKPRPKSKNSDDRRYFFVPRSLSE